jgi:hypothetical protein
MFVRTEERVLIRHNGRFWVTNIYTFSGMRFIRQGDKFIKLLTNKFTTVDKMYWDKLEVENV